MKIATIAIYEEGDGSIADFEKKLAQQGYTIDAVRLSRNPDLVDKRDVTAYCELYSNFKTLVLKVGGKLVLAASPHVHPLTPNSHLNIGVPVLIKNYGG